MTPQNQFLRTSLEKKYTTFYIPSILLNKADVVDVDCRPNRQEGFQTTRSLCAAVIKKFRANQGVLLAGAVAYYTLLSLVPLLILILMALSHIVPKDRLLLTLSEYLEFVVPGQSAALVEEVRTFLAQK